MDLTLRTKQFESDLKVAEDTGDPMDIWTKYLEWLEGHHYSSHSCYSDTLMQSVKYFDNFNSFNSDVRLANIYIKLAAISADSEAVFKHMLSSGVCTQHAVVYDAYAKSLEMAGSVTAAVQVIQQGILNRAQPVARLHKRLDEMKGKSSQVFNEKCCSNQPNVKNYDQDSPRTEDFYCTPGIVVHYDKRGVYPPEGGERQIEELRTMMKQYRPPPKGDEPVEMEMTEVCFGNITLNVPIMAGVFKSQQLPANKENVGTKQSVGAASKVASKTSSAHRLPLRELEDVDSELDRLCQEKPYQPELFTKAKELSDDSFSEALEKLEIQSTEKSTGQVHCPTVPECIPLEGSLGWGSRLGDSISTKLNFSDTENTSISRSSFQHNTNSESMQSFEIFHDSAVRDASRQQAKDSLKPPLSSNVRRPLQALSDRRLLITSKPLLNATNNQENQEVEYAEGRSELWQQTSHQNSMLVEGQEASFAPFHDSWANTSKQGQQSSVPVSCQPVVHVPLEAPIMGHTMNSSCPDASFTQVGICHPKQFDPTSTPMMMAKGTDFTFDMSAITDHHPPAPKVLGPLSPITEEPSSYKSSSSSRSSNSTGGSIPSEAQPNSHFPAEVDPFLPLYVNAMLNALSFSGDKRVVHLNSALPKLGSTICLDGCTLNLKKINEGGFASIYKAENDNLGPHVLKLQSPPCEWEVGVLVETQERLKKCSSKFLDCVMQVERAFIFTDCSVISFPYFGFGTLLDLSNACRSQTIDECIATFYTLEILHIVNALHAIGIIHADIKPDNFLLRDIRQFSDFRSALGHGLCLTDFGRAIDTTAFPTNTMFIGSCNTEDFQCVPMIEKKPWKWQTDWFGVAATVYVLIAGNYMKITKAMVSGLYKPHRNYPRRFSSVLWTMFFEKLINSTTSDASILAQLISEFENKMKSFSGYVFSSSLKKTISQHTQFLSH